MYSMMAMTMKCVCLSIFLFHCINGQQQVQAESQGSIMMKAFSINKIFQARDKQKAHKNPMVSDSATINNNSNYTQPNPLYSTVQPFFLEQRLDHFASHPCDSMMNRIAQEDKDCHSKIPWTFQQRFFYSNRFVTQTNSVLKKRPHGRQDIPPTFAFLCIGGEGPDLDASVLVDSVHCTGDMIELAEKLHQNHGANVHLFALEHRYYGLSYPEFHNNTSPVSNHHLIYLSSRQALSDLATFIVYINNHSDFLASTSMTLSSSSIPWIAFGGSYPGMLAAWLRLKFPHLVLGSVSNSAPIQVTENFSQYKEKVAWDLANTDIGGSQDCLTRIQQGHEDLYSLLQKSSTGMNVSLVADMFHICHGTDSFTNRDANIKAFLGDGVVDIPAQENDPNCEEDFCNVEKICTFLTTFQGDDNHPASSHVQALAALSNAQIQKSSSTCKNIDWYEMLAFLSSPDAQIEGIRSWLWQTCTEVGFFQTCPLNSTCPFGRGFHDIQQDLEICRLAFGIPSDIVQNNVDDTLAFYGGWFLQGTNILSVNGDVDPWSTMSAKSSCKDINNCASNSPSLWVSGASHHFWTHKSKTTDAASIIEIRQVIHNWVINLLFGADTVKEIESISIY